MTKKLRFYLLNLRRKLYAGIADVGGFINSTMIDNCTSEGGQIYNSSYVAKCNATAYTQSYSDNYVTAADDTAAGGWNHTGILTWKSNKWQDA